MSNDIWRVLFGVWCGIMMTFGFTNLFYDQLYAYKQGQIDAMTGKMQFELKQQSDGTVKWERKEK